tara:strand:- start:82 stop:1041 length:960 start_codon:yes stop_codon:yes gene_type:complete
VKNLVSIVTITYNQESELADCIEGVLKQDLSLIKEYIIADDASNDGTKKIIEKYHGEYPELIKPIYRAKNLGIRENILNCWKSCNAKYIASCAGDDIWIDKNHIAKQVQKLEKNYNYNLIGTNSIRWLLNKNKYNLKDKPLPGKTLSPVDYLIGGPIVGSTYIWRNNISEELFDIYKNHGDTRFYMYLAYKGAFYDRRSISTIYRVSKHGAFLSENSSNEIRINNYIGKIYNNNIFDKYSEGQYSIEIKKANNILIRRIIKNCLRAGKFFDALVFFYRYDYSISNSQIKRFVFKIIKLFLSIFDGYLMKSYNRKVIKSI